MHCPKCLSDQYVKNGIKYNKQRYKCKKCGCHFTQSHKRGASLETKLMALNLYLEGMGLRAIGRILKVSNVTVLYWIRSIGQSVKAYVQTHLPDDIRHVDIIEMDEMWHFTKKKTESSGYGSLSIGIPKKSLLSQLEAEAERPTKS
ncbi:MAG: IS1 family transposase [Candidatus Margulisbacteria bacterium]|nr:IS1 family transposase [Candidatus Margulisiibacteriota bacterium]